MTNLLLSENKVNISLITALVQTLLC